MDVLTFEICWALNNEIIKQVTSSGSIVIQLLKVKVLSIQRSAISEVSLILHLWRWDPVSCHETSVTINQRCATALKNEDLFSVLYNIIFSSSFPSLFSSNAPHCNSTSCLLSLFYFSFFCFYYSYSIYFSIYNFIFSTHINFPSCLTTFICPVSRNLGASTTRNPVQARAGLALRFT